MATSCSVPILSSLVPWRYLLHVLNKFRVLTSPTSSLVQTSLPSSTQATAQPLETHDIDLKALMIPSLPKARKVVMTKARKNIAVRMSSVA